MVTKAIEWEGERTRLVKLSGLPGKGYRTRRAGSKIEAIFLHQSAGNRLEGIDAPIRIARFHAGDPKYKRNEDGALVYRDRNGKHSPIWVGGGRGWPGIGYTFVVPAIPATEDGKLVVYRCHEDDRHTYHTGGVWNRIGVAVCFAGHYASRHARAELPAAPDPLAMLAGKELILDYLLPRYGLDRESLRGHFDAGKPACPGDALEAWVRAERGEDVTAESVDPFGKVTLGEPVIADVDGRPLKTWKERQAALDALGFDAGPIDGIPGEQTKGAVLAFQKDAGLVVDGRWGPNTALAVRLRLTETKK